MRHVGTDDIVSAINWVEPGLIRVGADELTYHLHILMRFELEVALLGGEIKVPDLPQLWTERSAALLGVVPECDRDGVLQDVHWSLGMIGYFPSYSIGSLYAAQLVEAYERGRDLGGEIARGDLLGLGAWLADTVHAKGHSSTGEEIIATATGTDLAAAAFFRRARKIVDFMG
jgi:carboxypeptidase Taq